MSEHDPADEEWMARLLCAAGGDDPDGPEPDPERITQFPPNWTLYKKDAIRALDWMQANGVKMITPKTTEAMIVAAENSSFGIEQAWKDMHDAAPLTPRGE